MYHIEQKEIIDSVCLVVHLHGFYFDHYRGFKVQEMGYCAVESSENGSYRYQMVRDYKDLSQRKLKTAKFVINRVHGLTNNPREYDRWGRRLNVEQDLMDLYEQFRTDQRFRLGYKGRSNEKNLLENLGIPFVNLERLGCIAYGEIPKINQRVGCGMHVKGKEDACSQLKCVRFVEFIQYFVEIKPLGKKTYADALCSKKAS